MNHSGPSSSSAQPAASASWIGRVVGQRWRILSVLDDSGGMASVYLAEDTRLGRKAAVKIPKAAHLNEEFRARFDREAKWHAQVENLHGVNIFDRGEEGGVPFLVLQYLAGGNLKAWCARNPTMLEHPRLHFDAWLLPVAQALDAVAAQGIVHRDVKPANVLFDVAGQAYLSDFGIVKASDERTLTGTGMFIGTLQFMSPEQCQPESQRVLDGRSDQYGLAMTVYQVLTGWKYPVEDDTAVVYAAKFGHVAMRPGRAHDPRIPAAVDAAVLRALAPDRAARYGSSVEFARAVLAGFGHLGGPAAGAPQHDAVPPLDRAHADTVPRRVLPTVADAPFPAPVAAPVGDRPRSGRRRLLVAGLAATALAATILAVVAGTFMAGRLSGGGHVGRLRACLEAAREELRAGHWPEAAAQARTLLARLDARDPRQQALRGDALRLLVACSQADAADAVAAYDAALAGSVRDAELFEGRGRALRWLDREAEAIASFDESLALRPDDADTLESRGLARMAIHEDDAALADLSRAARLKPADARFRISLASIQRRLGQQAEARAALEDAVDLALAADDDCRRGAALADLRRWQEAVEAQTAALGRDPRNLEALSLRSAAHGELGDGEAALADAREIARRDAGNAGNWLRIGGVERDRLHDPDAALASFTRGLAIAPRDVPLLLARGALRSSRNEYDTAVADFDAAAAANPAGIEVHGKRASLHVRRREFAAALACYDRLIALVPRYPFAYSNRAAVQRSLGHEDRALADCDQALALLPAVAHWSRGAIHREAKRWPETIEAYTLAIADDPGNARLFHDRAWVYNDTGDYRRAADDCRAGLAINPGDEHLQEELAFALKGLDDHDGAIAALTALIGRNPRGDGGLYRYRGESWYAKKEYAAARDDFARARDIQPLDPACWNWLGAAHREAGDLDQALSCFDEAIRLDRTNAQYSRNRGGVLHSLKRYADAIRSLDRAIALDPARENAFYWRGRCHEDAGDLARAEADFAEAVRLAPRDSDNTSALERVRKKRAQ